MTKVNIVSSACKHYINPDILDKKYIYCKGDLAYSASLREHNMRAAGLV
ncbi:MAG TPA: hypothetical protein VEG44_06715 [Candidatus Acidoferrales bacterium]|nr:hypothetical protein [Candidatus Acidoferrales bacterium]